MLPQVQLWTNYELAFFPPGLFFLSSIPSTSCSWAWSPQRCIPLPMVGLIAFVLSCLPGLIYSDCDGLNPFTQSLFLVDVALSTPVTYFKESGLHLNVNKFTRQKLLAFFCWLGSTLEKILQSKRSTSELAKGLVVYYCNKKIPIHQKPILQLVNNCTSGIVTFPLYRDSPSYNIHC